MKSKGNEAIPGLLMSIANRNPIIMRKILQQKEASDDQQAFNKHSVLSMLTMKEKSIILFVLFLLVVTALIPLVVVDTSQLNQDYYTVCNQITLESNNSQSFSDIQSQSDEGTTSNDVAILKSSIGQLDR